MKRIYFILFIIVLVAGFLRVFLIGKNPSSLTWDEVSWGYNAYSLGIDGKDEFGRMLPLNYLESFGDYKPPMYAYLDIIPIKIFGLTEFGTRFPSALFGTLTVLAAFLLTLEIFYKSAKKNIYALTASAVLALSPWHIMLSRAAFEANIATFFLVVGIWLFLKAVNESMWYLSLSAASFAASLYTFNTSRVFAPLILLFLLLSFWKKLWQNKKEVLTAFLIGSILLLPTLGFLFSPQAKTRFAEVNIFTDNNVVTVSNQEVTNDHNALWSKIIHNRRVLYSLSFLHHYFDNLSPNFLFISGDGNPKFSTQDVGELYIWDVAFILVGVFLLFKKREGNWFIIPVWLILGIIPAATARETPHALRIETTVPMFQILISYGIVTTFLFFQNHVSRQILRALIVISIVLLIGNIGYFLHGYYSHYPSEYSGEWQYGYKESISYVENNLSSYDSVYITDALGRPYIYYLFYTKTAPSDFRKNARITRDVFGFVHVESFNKFHFTAELPIKKGKILYVDIASHIKGSVHVLKTFYLLNGNPTLVAYAV